MQVGFADMVEVTEHAALEEGKGALNGVGVNE